MVNGCQDREDRARLTRMSTRTRAPLARSYAFSTTSPYNDHASHHGVAPTLDERRKEQGRDGAHTLTALPTT